MVRKASSHTYPKFALRFTQKRLKVASNASPSFAKPVPTRQNAERAERSEASDAGPRLGQFLKAFHAFPVAHPPSLMLAYALPCP